VSHELRQQFRYRVLRRDGELTSPVREGHESDAAQQHVEETEHRIAAFARSRNHDGDVLYLVAHENVELQYVGFQRDPTHEFQGLGVNLCQVLGRVTDHQVPGHRHPEHEGVDGIVRVLVGHVPEQVPPDGDEQESSAPLVPHARHLPLGHPRGGTVAPIHVFSETAPKESRCDPDDGRVLVHLKTKVIFVGKDLQKAFHFRFVKDDVDDETHDDRHGVPTRRRPSRARFQQFGQVTCRHGNKESGSMKRHHVVQFQRHVDGETE